MKRAAAVGDSPNRITLLRDADGDGVAEIRETFLDGLNQPFGMALLGDTFYVGNTDGVVAFPYSRRDAHHRAGPQADRLQARRPLDAQPAASPDGRKLYVGVGSLTNIGDNGMEAEEGRAGIYELDLASGQEPHLRLAACATRSAWRGSRRPARSGPWSTSATGSATRRRPTT